MIKVTAVSDIHGHILPELEEGDLLIVAGDLTARDQESEYFDFFDWIENQPFKEKIVVAGNHDMLMEKQKYEGPDGKEFHYLCDQGIELFGLQIWGTPRSLWFDGINPKCKAFTGSENDLRAKFKKIPDNIDILISHGPMYGVLDRCDKGSVGSYALRAAIDRVMPQVLITGHIHEDGGEYCLYKHCGPNTNCYNVSYVDEFYRPRNKPRTFEIKGKK